MRLARISARRRAEIRASRKEAPAPFAFGVERIGYDRIWPADVRMALSNRVLGEEPAIRQHLIATIRDRLTAAGAPVGMAVLESVFEEERAKLIGRRPSLVVRPSGELAAE